MLIIKLLKKYLTTFGKYLILMGRSFSVPERMRMFAKRYIKEMSQLGVDSIPIVLLVGVYHPRDYAARVFELHHVSHPLGQGGLQHRL